MITRKLLLLLMMWPAMIWSQTSLVKWYNADFSPSNLEKHISSSNIQLSGNDVSLTNEIWGSDNVFYSFNGNTSSATINTSRYIQFKVSPDAGYKIVFDQFFFNSRAQGGSNQKYQVRYSKNADFSSAVSSGEKVNTTNYSSNAINLNGITVNAGESLYIRIYVYNTYNNFHIEHNNSGSVAPYITGKVSLITPVVPKANDDQVGTMKNTALAVNILSNDDYQYTSPIIKINLESQAENGTVVVNGNNNVTYTPNPNFVGYDEFYYSLTNAVGTSESAKVQVQVIDDSGTYSEKVLVRWRSKTDPPQPTNYVTGVTGLNAVVKELDLRLDNDGSFNVYLLDGLPTPQVNNGGIKESNYLQLAIKAGTTNDYTAFLKKFNLEYKLQGGTGNLTIKYSKDPAFSTSVYSLVNNASLSSNWTVSSFSFDPVVSFLYPGETMYVRLYVHNTYNNFLIKYNPSSEVGPAIAGNVSEYYPETCTETVRWTAKGWIGKPSINKRAIIEADYDTAKNGAFEACSIQIKSGKLIIAENTYVTINKEINISDGSSIEVESDGNLIQVNKNIVNKSPITVKRNTSLKRNDYNYWGAPVSNQNLKQFSPNTLNTRFYTYNESNDLFAAIDPINNNFKSGIGYAIRAANNLTTNPESVTGVFTGIPNNGDVNVEIVKTRNGYNLVANPYPSNIDLYKFFEDNQNVINKTAYFWTNINPNPAMQGANYPNGGAINNYAILNASGGVPAAGPASKKSATPTQYVKVGQGFIVQAKENGKANLVFNNNIRTTNNNGSFFNRVSAKSSNEETTDRFWLQLTTPLDVANKLLIAYKKGATNDFEKDYDAPHLVIGSDSFYSILENKKLAIHGRKYPLVKDDVVPLGASFFADGTYTISLEEKEGIFESAQPIYLRDHFTGKITNLSQESYTFSAVKGVADQRFEILFKNETLGTDHSTKKELQVYQVNDLIKISSPENINKVSVYDASGRLMHQWKASGKDTEMDASKLSSGLYIVNIETINATLSKKIIKK